MRRENIDKVKNVGLRVHDQGVVTYQQNKLGLSAYYDKRHVLADGIHTRRWSFDHFQKVFKSIHRKIKNVT